MRFVFATIAPALTGAALAAGAAQLDTAGWQFAGSALWFLAVLCVAIAVLIVIVGVSSLERADGGWHENRMDRCDLESDHRLLGSLAGVHELLRDEAGRDTASGSSVARGPHHHD